MTSPSRRDVERRLSDLEGDGNGEAQAQETRDLSLSVEEKEALESAFDVEPETMKKP